MENVSSRCGKSDNAPRLRFPEFRGEWVEKKIKEFANCYAGATPSTKERKYWENGTIPWLSSGEVNKKHISFTDNFITKIGYDSCSTKMIPANTVVMALAGQGKTRGTVAITEIELCTNQSLASIVTNETVDDKFLLYYLETQYSNLRAISSGDGTRGGLNLNIINEYSVFLASLPEQKKIAAFFTLLDRRIQKQRQLVERLKTYKRGVSEAIFERRLNFSSLLATEWKKYKLGQIGEFYNGLSGKSREDFGNGNCKFITYMNVYKNIIADESLCESVKIRKEEEQNSVKYGDVLFTQSSETLEEVGYTSVWTHSSQPYLNSFCFGYRFYDSVMTNPIFIAHYMRSNYIRKAIMKEGQGATRVNLSAERLKNLNIFLPDINGQNKIAEFLSRLENRIHKEESVLEKMSTEKSSFLQKMFI